jgi:hypothetical protein
MKHILNNISENEKKEILNQYNGQLKIDNSKFNKLVENKLGNVKPILSEQSTTANQSISQQFQQGKEQGKQSGRVAAQNVKTFVKQGLSGAKEIVIKIGKIAFKAIILQGAFIFLIGKGLYKVGEVLGNALIKFLSATKQAVISGAQAVSDTTSNAITAIAQTAVAADRWVNEKGKAVGAWIGSMQDKAYSVITWSLNQMKQFGIAQWAKFLIMAAGVKEFGSSIANWCKQQYTTVASQIGATWDQAKSAATKGLNYAAQQGQKAVKAVSGGVQSFLGDVSKTAGQVTGFLGGLFGESVEFYSIYNSFNSSDTLGIITECQKYNVKVI